MPSGILLLDKPRGVSSNGALQRVRRLFGGEKAGHAGSLDPLATGMLPICLGEATKIAGYIVSGEKHYRFTVALGARTATGDAEGEVTESAAVPALTRAGIEAALAGLRGAQHQVPPMYSALKQQGAPLYRLARAGQVVERAPRAIEIRSLDLIALEGDSLELETRCSKGTYVRVLAEDIAVRLGTVGFVSALRRLSVEPFGRETMHPLDALERQCSRGERVALLPADLPLGHLARVALPPADLERLFQGQAIAGGGVVTPAAPGSTLRVRLYEASGRFLGLGIVDEAGTVRPKRLLKSD